MQVALLLAVLLATGCSSGSADTQNLSAPIPPDPIDAKVDALLSRMTLEEKIGQMVQLDGGPDLTDDLRERIKAGQVGSLLNVADLDKANELQRIASESRLGIPLLVARDVIHGFDTVFPLPLGQAASWNPELVERGARIAALEAAHAGINWTFAPMIDMSRDPRWGRVVETLGEDPYLTSQLAVAMVKGFQGDDLTKPGALAACAKHFAGYGASEAGRDYNTTNIPENELRNVHLPPFHAAVDAGVATLMTSFSDLNGVPASGNRLLLQQILRDEWGFDGVVVSDWASIEQLVDHGLAADKAHAAELAANAGVNMEMVSQSYAEHLADLIAEGKVSSARIDQLVAEILRVKFRLGLFDDPYRDPAGLPQPGNPEHLAAAREAALQSLVLLQNRDDALPLALDEIDSLAVVGPMADDSYEQLGTWIFDGDEDLSVTPLQAIKSMAGDDVTVRYVRALETTRSRDQAAFAEAREAAAQSDAVIVLVGEESILSGEAHSRANIDLPGAQIELVKAMAQTLRESGKPVIVVILAGRPLTVANLLDDADALLYAWHPGSMGGPAISDVLFGIEAPSGKLPITFPKAVGQIPIYYALKNTGKPATPDTYVHFDDLPVRGKQYAYGMTSHHLDTGFTPLYPFGFGLSYTEFAYSDIKLSSSQMTLDDTLTVSAVLRNVGARAGDEIVQLYVRDLVGDVTRPVRELKGFTRIRLDPGQRTTVSFELTAADLEFYNQQMRPVSEPGDFHVWVGGSSTADLMAAFSLVD